MASTTQRALANRAVQAANLMAYWSGQIEQEMAKQGLEARPRPSETVTLNAEKVARMLLRMLILIDEIHELQGNLAKERIRARRPSAKLER